MGLFYFDEIEIEIEKEKKRMNEKERERIIRAGRVKKSKLVPTVSGFANIRTV